MSEPTTALIANRYQIEAEIGRGGFAIVYRAYDQNTDRRVALKVIHGNFASEPNFVKRFRQEARAAARLRHPNIVDIYDVGDDGGTLYLAMPLIGEGRTLRDLLRERGRLALEEALPILSQVAAALDHLHGQKPPLVHRDLKPANLLLEADGDGPTVLLSDFGLVRVMQDSEPFTRSGETMGTAAYMAPEQIDPQKWGGVTPAADMYALGVLAYEMLTGGPPFGAGMAATDGHLNAAPPDPRERVPDLGDDLSEVLLRGLAKAPAERYPSARTLVDALRAVAEARTTQAAQAAECVKYYETTDQSNLWTVPPCG